MINPVLILTHNNLELTKRCVESVRGQDVDTVTLVIDNGSTDGTVEWLTSEPYPYETFYGSIEGANHGVSKGWNWGLRHFFEERVGDQDHVLVVNNDTILPPWFYSTLLSYEGPFITGVSVDQMEQISGPPSCIGSLRPHPDFVAFLIRRECWEKVGPFDERMVMYAQDLDYHIRAHKLGVPLMNCGCPIYHEHSSTLKKAPLWERRKIEEQANRDRQVLREKWGVSAGGPDYAAIFKEPCGQVKA